MSFFPASLGHCGLNVAQQNEASQEVVASADMTVIIEGHAQLNNVEFTVVKSWKNDE